MGIKLFQIRISEFKKDVVEVWFLRMTLST